MVKNKGILTLGVSLLTAMLLTTTAEANVQAIVEGGRIAGSDRYETSINISKAGWPVSSTSGVAVIATGNDFPDALSAAPLAKKYDAPILLSDYGNPDPELSSELMRLNIKKVYIIGGPGVISSALEDKINKMGIESTRLYGNDRYETSVAIAREIGPVNNVIVTTGSDFPDALSIASWAAKNEIPILLSDRESLPKCAEDYIKNNNITSSTVVGGPGVVGESVVSKLPGARRIYGQDRFGTNAAVLNTLGSDFDLNKVYLATGNDFPDALSGSALAAKTGSPIILTDAGPLPSTRDYIDTNIGKIKEIFILGGEGVVNDSAAAGVAPPIVTGISISLSSPSVAMNKEVKAQAIINTIPANAQKPSAVYRVGDTGIAKVSQDGTITGLGVGNTRITASVGSKSASTNLLVKMDKLIVVDPGHGGSSTGAIPTGEDGVTKLMDYRESILNMQVAQKVKRNLESVGAKVVLTRQKDADVSLEDRAQMANDLNADWFISIHHNSATNRDATGTSAYYSSYKPNANGGTIYVYASGTGPVYDMDGKAIGNVASGSRYEYVNEFAGDDGEPYVSFKFNGSIAKVKTSADYISIKDRRISTVVDHSAKMAQGISEAISSLGLVNRGTIMNDFAVNRLSSMASVLVEIGFISNTDEFNRLKQDSFQESIAQKITEALINFYESSEVQEIRVPATF